MSGEGSESAGLSPSIDRGTPMRILVIEDDKEAASYLAKGLSESGYAVATAEDGHAGLDRARRERFDAMIVDRMLPGLDGLSLIAALRAANNHTPALVLSALDGVEDRVTGLRAGCDDYLGKPFALSELLARLDALSRRASTETKLQVGDLELDLLARTAARADQSIELLAREFRLLEYLMRNAGHIVTRTMLLEKVWGHHFALQTNVIDVHMCRLRQKIDKGFDRPILQTIRGLGYTLTV
jgi:two-component system OmpR family response regulator